MSVIKIAEQYQVSEDVKLQFFSDLLEGSKYKERFLGSLDRFEIQGSPEQVKKFTETYIQNGFKEALKLLESFDWLVDDKRNILSSGVNWKRDSLVFVQRYPGFEEVVIETLGYPRHLYLDYYLSDRHHVTITDFLMGLARAKETIELTHEEKELLSKLTWSFHSSDQSMIRGVKLILEPFLRQFEKD